MGCCGSKSRQIQKPQPFYPRGRGYTASSIPTWKASSTLLGYEMCSLPTSPTNLPGLVLSYTFPLRRSQSEGFPYQRGTLCRTKRTRTGPLHLFLKWVCGCVCLFPLRISNSASTRLPTDVEAYIYRRAWQTTVLLNWRHVHFHVCWKSVLPYSLLLEESWRNRTLELREPFSPWLPEKSSGKPFNVRGPPVLTLAQINVQVGSM